MDLISCLFLLLSLLSATVFADAGGGCFLPNGKPADLAARCWDAGGRETGLCCQAGDHCLNNTLCAGEFGGEPFYYRGYCTDSGWKGPGCPDFCVASDQKDRIPAVYRCNGDDKKKQGGWYCGGDGEPRSDDCEPGYFRLDDNMEPYGIAGTKPELSPVTSSAEKPSTGAGDSARDLDVPAATNAPSTLQTSTIKPSDARVSLDPATPTETHIITIAQPITPVDPPSGTRPAPDPPASSTAKPSDTRPPPDPPASSTTKPGSVQPSLGQPPVPTSTKPSAVQPSLGQPPSTTPHPSPSPSPAPSPSINPPTTSSPTTTTTTTSQDPNSIATDLPPPPTPSPSPSPSNDPNPDSSDKPTNSAVPIAVGVAVGGAVFIAASALLFFYQRRRHRRAPVRAETPPPFEFALINSQAPEWLGPAYGTPPPPPPVGVKRPEAARLPAMEGGGGDWYGVGRSEVGVVGGGGGGGNGMMGMGMGMGMGNGNARGVSEVGGTARFELA